jgi:hypothetical protein
MNKRALLIGINNYLYYPESSLDGCVNDTKIMAAVLTERFGFSKDDITFLWNEDATRDAIISQLTKILETCRKNDIIVFHFSGHGSRRLSSIPQMPDGLEETIMPHDTGSMPHLNRDIRDSDMRNWLALLTKKTSNVNLFFDSCHSGSMLREAGKIRGINTDSREILPSSAESANRPSEPDSVFPSSSANWLALSDSYSLLTACKKNELASEYQVKEIDRTIHYGAFTYFLVRELIKAPTNFTYQDVFEQLRIKMQTAALSQTPQIEGESSQRLFSGVKMNTMQYVSVKNRVGNEITLSAGAAHGLTINSQWAIYPSAAKHASPGNELGSVSITSVDTITSTAGIVEENGHQIQAGCRAVEESHYYGNPKYSVYIDNLSAGAEQVKKFLSNDIDNSSWLKIAGSESEADFVVSLLESKAENSSNNEFQIKILQAGNTHFLLHTAHPFDNDFLKIRRNLETLSRYSTILELDNPSSKLRDFVEFTLLRKIDGQWHEAKPDYNDLPKYFEDEALAFRVINKSPVPIYVSILDLGLTKKIRLLYPPRAASERVGSQQAATAQNPGMGILQAGISPNEKITLFIPETVFLTDFSDINEKGGIEVFKLIAATEQTDFSWLQQDGMSPGSIRNKASLPEKLLYEYLIERQSRECRIEVNKSADWFTINRGFYLLKR